MKENPPNGAASRVSFVQIQRAAAGPGTCALLGKSGYSRNARISGA